MYFFFWFICLFGILIVDPNIDEVTCFSGGVKTNKFLSYSNKQLIAREIEMEKIRRAELHKTGGAPVSKTPKRKEGDNYKKKDELPSSQLPNHLQTLTPIAVKGKVTPVSTYYFKFYFIAKIRDRRFQLNLTYLSLLQCTPLGSRKP